MDNEKKVITVTISDINDEEKVLKALTNLFSEMFTYYINTGQQDKVYAIAMSCGVYFGQLLRMIGVTPEDINGKNEDNDKQY